MVDQTRRRAQSAARSRRYYRKIVASGGKIYKSYIEKIRIRQAKYRKALRLKVIMAYGGKCSCCGTKELEFLSVDHVHGGGNKHRKKIGYYASGQGFYKWLIRKKFPKRFRVLCHNCNLSRGFYGYCPHTKTPE